MRRAGAAAILVAALLSASAAEPSPAPRVPKSGTYVYATMGSEEIDALTGQKHTYPSGSTVTVARGGCGLKLTWRVIKERSTTWEWCPRRGGFWLQRSVGEIHEFFGRRESTVYRCRAGDLLRPAGDRPGRTWTTSCSTGSTTEAGTGEVVGRETIVVGGVRVRTVHLRVRTELTGDTTGTTVKDYWLARSNGLLVRRREENRTTTHPNFIVGDVHYTEQFEIKLTSLRPRH